MHFLRPFGTRTHTPDDNQVCFERADFLLHEEKAEQIRKRICEHFDEELQEISHSKPCEVRIQKGHSKVRQNFELRKAYQ